MQEKVYAPYVQDISSVWTSEDPTLKRGQRALELDTGKIKIGDGVTAWTSLPYRGQINNSGLVVVQQTVSFDEFTDNENTTGTLELDLTIPAGAYALQSAISDVTGFAGDTSAVITIGDGTDVDRYNTGTPNIFADAANIDAGAVSGTDFHSDAKTVTLTVTSAVDFTAITAGQATITLFYYVVD